MKTSEKLTNIFKAQIAMQAELQNIAKDSKGYGYKYTSLEKLIEYIKPIMNKHKLGFIQTTTSEDDKIGVTTRLIHESGEWVEDTMTAKLSSLAKMNEYQVAGSIVTYFRRYGLSAIIGIASDEDVDMQTPPIARKPIAPALDTSKISTLLKETGTDMADFLAYFKVSHLGALNAQQYSKAITMLEKKAKE